MSRAPYFPEFSVSVETLSAQLAALKTKHISIATSLKQRPSESVRSFSGAADLRLAVEKENPPLSRLPICRFSGKFVAPYTTSVSDYSKLPVVPQSVAFPADREGGERKCVFVFATFAKEQSSQLALIADRVLRRASETGAAVFAVEATEADLLVKLFPTVRLKIPCVLLTRPWGQFDVFNPPLRGKTGGASLAPKLVSVLVVCSDSRQARMIDGATRRAKNVTCTVAQSMEAVRSLKTLPWDACVILWPDKNETSDIVSQLVSCNVGILIVDLNEKKATVFSTARLVKELKDAGKLERDPIETAVDEIIKKMKHQAC